MIKQQLDDFMVEEGYTKIPSNLPEFTIYVHPESNCVNVLNVIDYREELYIPEDQYEHIKDRITGLFTNKGIENIHILSLIISSDVQKARKLCREDALCWMINPCENRLVIYENQTSDFYGMRDKLEYWLCHLSQEGMQTDRNLPEKRKKKFFPAVTVAVVCINVIVFLICAFTGELLYNKGALSVGYLLEQGDYYRILTSMFLHWDMDHLFGNMLILFYLGEVVEKYFGHIRFGILYFTAGICGNLLSMGIEIYKATLTVSAGASGAIFGIIGGLLLLVIVHRGHLEQITLGRLAVMIIYSLYSGFVGSNINNAAHVGGFLSGIITALILWIISRPKEKDKIGADKV